jgi:spatacsin
MSTSRQGDDGPAVLQLCRWTLSETHLKLSKFREAFISPTRRLFGLLSDYGEAL